MDARNFVWRILLIVKPLNMLKPLKPDEARKLITVCRPPSAHAGCLLCLSSNHVRVITSPITGEEVQICKPCIADLAKRQVR